MAGIDEVLERLLMDGEFALQLARDPVAALAGYELTADDLTLLSSQVSFDPGALSLVEERVSKAGMFGLLSTFTAGLGGLSDVGVGQGPSPHMLPGPDTSVGGAIDPAESRGIIINWTPGDVNGAGDPDGVVAPVDSSGLQGPDDAGGAVSIKEVDPAPQPGAEAHGGGGGEGEEVSIKEVDPAPAPSTGGIVDPGDKVGFNPQPDPPGEPLGGDGSVSPHIIVQGGAPAGIIGPVDTHLGGQGDAASPHIIVQGG